MNHSRRPLSAGFTFISSASAALRLLLLGATAWLATSQSALGQASPVPTAPSNAVATYSIIDNSTLGIRVSWQDNSTDENGFQIEYYSYSSGWQHLTYVTAGTTTTTYYVNGAYLSAGTTFFTRVRALKGTYVSSSSFTPLTSWSGYSNSGTFTWPNVTGGPFTNNPPALSAITYVNTDTPRFTWTDNSNCESVFAFEARDTGTVGSTFQPMFNLEFNQTQADVFGYLLPGHTYEVRLRAGSAHQGVGYTSGDYVYSSYSNVVTTTVPGTDDGAPLAPANLTVSAFLSGTTYYYAINWDDKSTTETDFELFEKATGASDTTYASLGVLGGASGVNNGIGVSINNSYTASSDRTFRVRAIKGRVTAWKQYSGYSNAASATMGTFGAPTDMRISNPADDGKIQLFWSDNATGEVGYELETRIGGSSGTFQSLGTLGVTGYSRYQSDGGIPGFPPSSQVDFRVRAYQGSSQPYTYSAYSNTATITTQPLTAPSGVAVSQITKNGARVSWTDNSGNETNYQILYRNAGSGSYQLLKSSIAKLTTPATGGAMFADVTGLSPGTSYDIIVRASYDYSDGSYIAGTNSSVATFTTKDGFTSNGYASITLNQPFTYQATVSSSSPRVSWEITGLPLGLTFNSATGQVTGTPTVTGLFNAAMTATFQNGVVDNATLALRILTPAGPPVVGTAIGPISIPANGVNSTSSLNGKFSDPDAESAVKLQTTLGDINIILYNSLVPQTVTNFLAYVNAGRYTNVAFHRAANLSFTGATAGNRDILQGGGYTATASPDIFADVSKFAPLVNEPGLTNVTDTIAMAKLGGQPDSATSEFFFNIKNNATALDNNNGGFTVFGRVAIPTKPVMQAITDLPTGSYTVQIGGQGRGPFADWPMNAPAAPSSMNIASIVKINAATVIPTMTYSITGNTSPSVVTATTSGTDMVFTPLSQGQSDITVRATDLDGNTVTQTFTLTVVAPSTNADLSNLATTAGTIAPVFAAGTLGYTASVPNATTSVTVTPTVADSTATVKVNNVTVASGSASGAINLSPGDNTINVVVTAQDNVTTKTYTLVVTRAANPAEIAVEQPVGTGLSDNSGSVSFGSSVTLGTSQTLTFTIKNLGTADLTGLAITKDGANSGEFAVNSSGMSTTVAPAGSTTFSVTFTPSSTGARAAAIHIASNDSDENPFDINLTGTCSTPKAQMTSPAQGSTLTSASVTFNWSAGTGVTGYALWVGSTLNGHDIYAGNEGTNLSKTLTVPDDGRTLYVTLHSLIGGSYQTFQYTYTAFTAPTPVKAQITAPVNGSTLSSNTLNLQWNAGVSVTQYVLYVGTTAGGYDLYAGVETGSNRTVTVPTTGGKVYATLYSLIKGTYQPNYYVFNTASPVKAALAAPSPANGATLTSGTLDLTWTQGTGVSRYVVYIGSAYGKYDITAYDAGSATNHAFTVPTDGGPVYVTLYSLINGGYQANNYWFTTFNSGGPRGAVLTSHANASVLSATNVTFQWDAGTSVTKYALWVGSTPDGYDLYAADEGTGRSRAVTLPGDGRQVYVTVHSLISGLWQSNSYYFTAFTSPAAQGGQITSPATGSTLSTTSLALTWNTGSGATSFALWVGNAPSGYDIYAGAEGSNTSKTVTVPSDGRPVYVTLYSLINGVYVTTTAWYITPNTETTTNKARMTSPSNGATLTNTNSSQTFTWDSGLGLGATPSFALWIGSNPGGYDLYAGAEGANTSKTVNLPTDGRKIYVTLHSLIGGAYKTNSYFYTTATVTPGKATMASPVPGTTFSSASVTFNWTAGTGVTSYALWVGRKPGGYDLVASAETGTSKAVTVPADGGPIYVTLYSVINGVYQSNEYIYQAPIQ